MINATANLFRHPVALSGSVIALMLSLQSCATREEPTAEGLQLPADQSLVATDVSGMLMYQADAAVLRECTTGKVFPVRMEEAWLETERAYLSLDDSHPGWVHTSGPVELDWGPPMEGPDRWHVTFLQTPSLDAGATCGQSLQQIQDVTWRAVYLEGLPRDRFDEGHSPRVTVREDAESDDGSVAIGGNTGCNQFGGSAHLDGDRLHLGDMAATRMYCMNTADIESRFLEITTEVAYGSLEGDRWVWYDASGRWLAEFAAQE
ncbi:MAG: META domain-containing protein [Natronospirillum sp.]|uniref:META domain-containing protein n=1 Tax=Natronospirillum sp. TaxID=2812955 RepID=UPI0025FDCE09|nr:META domain-containing protein [Natronospirillum sp.]MCH8552139.1 META domain-containing protein [Natronospirillum sp.]